MVELAGAQSERRKHSRLPAQDLVVEIRGKRYDVLDISFGGIKVAGSFTVAGGLVDVTISPLAGTEKAEVRGRVERVDGDLTVVRFSHLTDALTRLITRRLAE